MPSPLVTEIFTADPSAHSFNGKIYVYPSHDRESNIPFNDRGDQYDMEDYHVLSMDDVGGEVTDHGVALKASDVPWVSKQVWAPDCAKGQDGKYYLYFPARDKEGIFRLGVAVSDKPEGPFKPQPEAIKDSFSIDPASFVDDDGSTYLYFGGIWGGQLQCYSSPDGGKFDASQDGPHEPSGKGVKALCPRVGKMTSDMLEFAEPVKELVIQDENGEPLQADDHDRRFFEASWMHKYNGKYYFSYSTGDTHFIVYAIGDSPYGPFTYAGKILEPVKGWTTHHSIVEHKGKWYLFYHDCELSKGVDHLRSAKARELKYDADGKIITMKPE
ncbi:glycoside hydrolase family 43 protein [Kockovaella imperatae]|uniref:Glycoside hydrolase family 43 protein n=1 Tax=Kockovaella imperatae TaxID=4999 RepID=A0A1Y1UJA6_9TREE|nr:glycoside hydrolase family 43 protein [Kockovaella imperatae]ORX37627.1 glycoside hydrolase family 43 protein [Kockovaella imperatae]